MTPEDINEARAWLATIEPVGGLKMLPTEIQRIVDTIEQSLELAMEDVLRGDSGDRICPAGHVLMPQSAEEAKGMILVAESYLAARTP